MTAIIGETGAGKTTLIKFLYRFYDVSEGSISINNQDVRGVTVHNVRERLGLVPQDPRMMSRTVNENIRYHSDATDDDVIEACKRVGLHPQLSGGEKQRVAIARAILTNPKILVLDEATSSVDNVTEAKIQDALAFFAGGAEPKTMIVIAHRLSTIRNADKIVVIHEGKVCEQGTPEELIERRGKYYEQLTASSKKM
ncbi:hypothetical protein MMC10_007604 [Thelotrema lepadinum]|nr:hypothetical protein [Thelotrema lepadinum]